MTTPTKRSAKARKRRWRMMDMGETVRSTDGYGPYKMGCPMDWSGHKVLAYEVGRFWTRRLTPAKKT